MSEEGERSTALSAALVDAPPAQYQRSAFRGDDELVFCHPKRGSKIDHEWYAAEFRAALAEAVEGYVRPFRDARHGSPASESELGVSVQIHHGPPLDAGLGRPAQPQRRAG